MGRISYDELARKCKKQELRLAELESALRESDRALVGYGVSRWVSIPLPAVQADAVREVFEDLIARQAGEGDRIGDEVDGVRRYELAIRADDLRHGRPLAEYAAYCVRYSLSREEGTSLEKVWALVPV